MPDKGKVIKWLEEAETMLTHAVDQGGGMSVTGVLRCLLRVTDAIVLLKEQPQIVRCKDCKYYNSLMGHCKDGRGYPSPEWFCADGLRREEDG